MIMQKLGAGNFDHVRPCPKCTQSLKNKISNYMLALVGVTLTQFRLVIVTFTWPCTKFTQIKED